MKSENFFFHESSDARHADAGHSSSRLRMGWRDEKLIGLDLSTASGNVTEKQLLRLLECF